MTNPNQEAFLRAAAVQVALCDVALRGAAVDLAVSHPRLTQRQRMDLREMTDGQDRAAARALVVRAGLLGGEG